jgi:hypothetical protein
MTQRPDDLLAKIGPDTSFRGSSCRKHDFSRASADIGEEDPRKVEELAEEEGREAGHLPDRAERGKGAAYQMPAPSFISVHTSTPRVASRME